MIESKGFYRRIEQAFTGAGRARTREGFAHRLAPRLFELLGGPLALAAVHLYDRRGAAFAPARRWGEERPDLHAELAERFADAGEAGIHELPWVGDTAAGATGLFAVGGADGPLLALIPAAGEAHTALSRAELLSALNSLVYAVRQRLERRQLEDVFEQARAIQLSLLPDGRQVFEGFDVFAVSMPAESVGGDLYDYFRVDAETLGFAVADASGHGLPAALQARDVATGLRMGVEGDLKITRLVEKLNRVIHRSGLASRFVSLVFGELERNGNLAYVNAGHPPPLLLDERGVRELSVGGMILGPDPEARYKLGFTHVDRGASLAVYSDGVLECGTGRGEPFGLERLREWLAAWALGPSEDAIADLLRRLAAHGGGASEDDVTVMLLRRT